MINIYPGMSCCKLNKHFYRERGRVQYKCDKALRKNRCHNMWVIHQNAITRLYDGSTSLSEIDVIQQMKQLLMHWRIFAHFSSEAFKLSNFPISHCADGNFP